MKSAFRVVFLFVLLLSQLHALPKKCTTQESLLKSWFELKTDDSKKEFVDQLIEDLTDSYNFETLDTASQVLVEIIKYAIRNNVPQATWVIEKLRAAKKNSPSLDAWFNSILFATTESGFNSGVDKVGDLEANAEPAQLLQVPASFDTKYYEGINFVFNEPYTVQTLTSEELFPTDPAPKGTDFLITQLGNVDIGVRESAYQALRGRTILDWKKIFNVQETTPDPEIRTRLGELIHDRISELVPPLDLGSIKQLREEDLAFIFDNILPYLLHCQDPPYYMTAFRKMWELAEREEFVLHILSQLTIIWKNTNTVEYLEPVSDVLFNIAHHHPGERAFVEGLFREIYVSGREIQSLQATPDSSQIKNTDMWLDLKLPYYLGLISSDTPHDLFQSLLSSHSTMSEAERAFNSMRLVALARNNIRVWLSVKAVLFNERVPSEIRKPLLDYIYLIGDENEIKETLFSLSESPCFIIKQTALIKLTFMLNKATDTTQLEEVLFKSIETTSDNIMHMRDHLYLFKYTFEPPSLMRLKTFLESTHYEIREVAYEILMKRDHKVNNRTIFNLLCELVVKEKEPLLKNYILDKLLQRNYFAGVPMKYFILYKFLYKTSDESLVTRVRDFLKSFPFPTSKAKEK